MYGACAVPLLTFRWLDVMCLRWWTSRAGGSDDWGQIIGALQAMRNTHHKYMATSHSIIQCSILKVKGNIVECSVLRYYKCLKALIVFYMATPCHTIESVWWPLGFREEHQQMPWLFGTLRALHIIFICSYISHIFLYFYSGNKKDYGTTNSKCIMPKQQQFPTSCTALNHNLDFITATVSHIDCLLKCFSNCWVAVNLRICAL